MVKEFNITLDIKKEPINNKITGLNLNDEATIKIKFVQNSLPYDINNKDIRIDYRLPNGVLLFQNENTGVTKIDGNTINIKVINQALQQVGEIVLDVSIFEKSTSKKITTSKLILKVDSIIYKEEQLSTDFDALQTALNDSKKLESKFGTAKDLDNKLEQDFKIGTTLDNTLKEDIKNANTSKSNLDTTISTANTANNNLKNTINKADTTTYATRGEVKTLTTQYEDLANKTKSLDIKNDYYIFKKEWSTSKPIFHYRFRSWKNASTIAILDTNGHLDFGNLDCIFDFILYVHFREGNRCKIDAVAKRLPYNFKNTVTVLYKIDSSKGFLDIYIKINSNYSGINIKTTELVNGNSEETMRGEEVDSIPENVVQVELGGEQK